MTSGIQEELQGLATQLLERRGGLVDWPGDARAGTAVVPNEVAALLDAQGEMMRLTSEPGGGGWYVGLAGDFLETSARLLEAEPRIGDFAVGDLYLKRSGMEEAVRRAFTWLNAKVNFVETRAVTVEYHTWWLHASVASDDRWETQLAVTINARSGVEVHLPDPLGLWELVPRPAAGRDAASTYGRAVARALPRVQKLAAEFFSRMDGRRERDRKRLREYYGALVREADRKKPRGKVEPDPQQVQVRKRAVDLELRRKLAELDERYAMEAVLEPVVLIRTGVTALAVDLLVYRKSARRTHTVYWNPLLKQLEPICCGRCGDGAFGVAFTDETVDPLCAACAR